MRFILNIMKLKDRENLGVIFKCQVNEDAGWINDFRDAKWSSVFKPEFPANLTGAS